MYDYRVRLREVNVVFEEFCNTLGAHWNDGNRDS